MSTNTKTKTATATTKTMTWLDIKISNVAHVLLDIFLSTHSCVYTVYYTQTHTQKYTRKLLLKNCQENENVSLFEPKMNLWCKSDLLHVRSNETCYINIHTKHSIVEVYHIIVCVQKAKGYCFCCYFVIGSVVCSFVRSFILVFMQKLYETPHRKFHEIFILARN